MSAYRVALRHTTLVESATLEPREDDQFFIATAAPPPTHSILTLHSGEETRYFLVDRVIELQSGDIAPGIVGKLTDAQAHEEASKLGTEHLEDGEPEGGDDATMAMAMPAPVVDPDATDDVDEEERRRVEAEEEAEGEAASAAGSSESDAAEPGEHKAEVNNSDESPPSNSRRGRRRRGRKRR